MKLKYMIAADLAGAMVAGKPAVQAPVFATPGSACFDLRAVSIEDGKPFATFIPAGKSRIFRTGLHMEIPPGYGLKIYSRSGHGFKNGIRLRNSVGIIDSDYRLEILVALQNDSAVDFVVDHGDRIAQAMLVEVPKFEFEEASELSSTERNGGFGSTGVK